MPHHEEELLQFFGDSLGEKSRYVFRFFLAFPDKPQPKSSKHLTITDSANPQSPLKLFDAFNGTLSPFPSILQFDTSGYTTKRFSAIHHKR